MSVTPDLPRKFSQPDQHLVRGLHAEAIARIVLPKPAWMTGFPDYRFLLRADEDDTDDFSQAFLSLNISFYNTQIIESEWRDMLFFMYGRFHPYALTWEIEPHNPLASANDTVEYCIPALIVRDHSYQASV